MWKWLLAVLKAFVLCFQETLKVKVKKTEDLGQPEVTGFQDDSIMQFFYWIKSVPFFQCTPLCDSGKIQFYRNGTNCPIISKLFKAYICSVLMISIHLWVKVHISDWRCFLNINFYYVKWMFLQLLQCKQKIIIIFFFIKMYWENSKQILLCYYPGNFIKDWACINGYYCKQNWK